MGRRARDSVEKYKVGEVVVYRKMDNLYLMMMMAVELVLDLVEVMVCW